MATWLVACEMLLSDLNAAHKCVFACVFLGETLVFDVKEVVGFGRFWGD